MIEKKIILDGTHINYKYFFDVENQFTIVILHGWGGTSDSWAGFGEKLYNYGYNVLIPDLPGFGKTEINKVYNLDNYAEIIENLVKKLELNNIILWGHSNGGAISIKIETGSNINTERLILNNSAGIRNNTKRSIKRKVLNNSTKILKKIIPSNGIFKKIRIIFYKLIGSSDYINSEENPFLKQTYLNMISSDLIGEIGKIKTNTLLIRGEKDTYTPMSDGVKMRKLIKNAKFVMIENQKHGIHLQAPDILLNTFLNNI